MHIQHPSWSMYHGAKPKLFVFARQMRMNPTEAEKMMWSVLKNECFSLRKFRQQHPLVRYIADFYCHEIRLVVEVDGGYHLSPYQKEYDDFRDEDMNAIGVLVCRITNDEVLNKTEFTVNKNSYRTG